MPFTHPPFSLRIGKLVLIYMEIRSRNLRKEALLIKLIAMHSLSLRYVVPNRAELDRTKKSYSFHIILIIITLAQ